MPVHMQNGFIALSEVTAEFLGITIPLMVLFFGLWVGIPMWMTFKRPDRRPRETHTVPAYLQRQPVPAAVPAQEWSPARVRVQRRELVSAGRETFHDHGRKALYTRAFLP
jgi:hypothetical protein